MRKKVAVAGASGYAGGELLRLLADHPEFEVVTATGHSSAGNRLQDEQPHLRSLQHLVIKETTAANLNNHDVVFFALPHGLSGAISEELQGVGLVVDCGADHRLVSSEAWSEYYGGDHFESWAYGVPELPILGGSQKQRDQLSGAKKVAAPGCNASTVALALAPGIAEGVIEASDIVSVLAVGPSGAGKVFKTHLLAAELMSNAHPYSVGGTHRHIPEIIQALEGAGAKNASLTFTPILVPMPRGILATTSAKIKTGVGEEEIFAAWQKHYADERFVRVLEPGKQPTIASVIGSNVCEMSLNIDKKSGRLTIVSAVDNLVKGTAGAAIQSANIALGLDESLGLPVNGVAP